jgi:DAPG hydrolase-like protein
LSAAALQSYASRPLAPPDPLVLEAIDLGPIDPAAALPLGELDRMLDPAPLPTHTGWCVLPDGVGFVAVQTAMPGVTSEMIDWWTEWHPRDPLRYRVWHPLAHWANAVEEPERQGAKRYWGAVHHPVEDIGTGVMRARVELVPPTEFGFATDALEDPDVGTIVCGYIGDDRRRVRHSAMAHVFLNERSGLTVRCHYWLGAAIRPYAEGALGDLGELLLNRRYARRQLLRRGETPAVARLCAEKYANLAALLPGLYARFA